MCDDDPRFNDGAIADGAHIAVIGRDGWSGSVHGFAPVREPEVVRAAQGRWRRWIGAWRGATVRGAARDRVSVFGDVSAYGLVCIDEAAAAELAADKIAAARRQLRLDLAAERANGSGDGWRLLPEHLAIAATLMLTLGNAAWHYMA